MKPFWPLTSGREPPLAVEPSGSSWYKVAAVGKIGDHPNNQQDNQAPLLRRAGLYLGVAFELPGTIIGGLAVGYFLDQYFGTSPWLLITLTALAFAGAIVRLMGWVKFFANERDARRGEKDDTAR